MNQNAVSTDVRSTTQRSASSIGAASVDRVEPSGERAAIEPDLFERAKSAVQTLRGRGRRANGQAGIGNTLNLRHGLRSTRLVEQPDIAAWHREEVAAIVADQGGDELTVLKRVSIREAARLEVIMSALGDELLSGGVLTGKGKMRAATTVYLQVLDRFVRVTSTIGLERRPRRLADTFEAAIAAEPEAR